MLLKCFCCDEIVLFSWCNELPLPLETFERRASVDLGAGLLLGGVLIRLCSRLWVFHVNNHCSTPSPGRRLLLEARVGKRSFSISLAGMQRFVTEGQHLQLTAITKEQSGSYECIASNDISSPDVRIVQVTVNCKSQRNKEIFKKIAALVDSYRRDWGVWKPLHENT